MLSINDRSYDADYLSLLSGLKTAEYVLHSMNRKGNSISKMGPPVDDEIARDRFVSS